jgi:hypothetical protein
MLGSRLYRTPWRNSVRWGSAILAQSLDFILDHQQLFRCPSDLGPERLVRVDEPSAEDCRKALEWFKSIESIEIEQLTSKIEGRPTRQEPSR